MSVINYLICHDCKEYIYITKYRPAPQIPDDDLMEFLNDHQRGTMCSEGDQKYNSSKSEHRLEYADEHYTYDLVVEDKAYKERKW